MRLLFLHLARQVAYEYNVHLQLAHHASARQVESYFVWQRALKGTDQVSPHYKSARIAFRDFGRDLSLRPAPPKYQRMAMMMRQLPGAIRFLDRHVREVQPDMLYTSQQWLDLYAGALLSKRFGIPHVVHIHYTLGPWLGRGVVPVLIRQKRLVAVSNFIRDQAIACGAPAQNIHTIYNPTDVQRFNQPKDRDALRAEFGWAPETPVIVAAGRLDPAKGHMRLLDAFVLLHSKLPQARLLLCGAASVSEGYVAQLRQRISDLQLTEHILLLGTRRDLPSIMAGADVFCLPTEDEAFGLVFLEAMAVGTPVVACSSGAVPEIVVDGETGLLSKLNDSAALAENLCRILADPTLAQQLGERGRNRALSMFAPETVTAQWVELLHQFQGRVVPARHNGAHMPMSK